MKQYDFSIVIFNNNTDNLLKCIKSIEEQNYDLNKIEVIIETEKLEKNIANKLPFFCKLREKKNINVSDCFNDALNTSNGMYMHFINSDTLYNDKTILKKIKKTNEKIILCKKNKTGKKYKINVNDDFILNTSLEYYFIKRENIFNKFDTSFDIESKIKFLIELVKDNQEINFVNAKIINDHYNENQYSKSWYNESLKNWEKFLYKMDLIPEFVQKEILFILLDKYESNLNDKNKFILDNDETKEFKNITKRIVSKLDDNVFINCLSYKVNKSIINFLFRMKSSYEDNIEKIFDKKINIYAINYKNKKLYFDCSVNIDSSLFNNIKIVYNNKKIDVNFNSTYSETEAFNEIIHKETMFDFFIDVIDNSELEAYIIINNKEIKLEFNFVKVQSRLNNSDGSYWKCNNFIIEYKKDKIIIQKSSTLKTLKFETKFLTNKLLTEKNKKRAIKLSFLRILYYFSKPFLKNKKIWVTFDKLYKAGDNGEYIYQYGLKNNKNIYYIIKKNCPDYKRLKKQKGNKILKFNSLKAKLYVLHSEAILKTHANILGYCGFDGLAREFVRGLFNAEIIEIQHGLTIQYIPRYQNRLVDNIKLYCCASKFEINNLKNKEYGYDNEMLKLTGSARYDGLINNEKKIILIIPTWRHNVSSNSIKHGTVRNYNNMFKKSKYYEIYNSLINNNCFVNYAKKYKYEIIYLIHPTLSSQINDFKKNDYVKIIAATSDISYEELLTNASIMITDYSGVQYDFAYMKKPIVYFHPKDLPPHYKNGGIDYKIEGFGPICTTEDELVNEIYKNLKNGCLINDKYKKRCENFFEYDDYNNCKRIINEIDNYLNNKEK